jgi:hypothetical protein
MWAEVQQVAMTWRVFVPAIEVLYDHRLTMPSSFREIVPELLSLVFSSFLQYVIRSTELLLPGESFLVKSKLIVEK